MSVMMIVCIVILAGMTVIDGMHEDITSARCGINPWPTVKKIVAELDYAKSNKMKDLLNRLESKKKVAVGEMKAYHDCVVAGDGFKYKKNTIADAYDNLEMLYRK